MSPERAGHAPIGRDTVPRLAGWVTCVEVDDEAVLYDERRDVLHRLDATATVVTRLIDGRRCVQEMVDELAGSYRMDPGRVEADVVAMVSELDRLHLLEPDGPG